MVSGCGSLPAPPGPPMTTVNRRAGGGRLSRSGGACGQGGGGPRRVGERASAPDRAVYGSQIDRPCQAGAVEVADGEHREQRASHLRQEWCGYLRQQIPGCPDEHRDEQDQIGSDGQSKGRFQRPPLPATRRWPRRPADARSRCQEESTKAVNDAPRSRRSPCSTPIAVPGSTADQDGSEVIWAVKTIELVSAPPGPGEGARPDHSSAVAAM